MLFTQKQQKISTTPEARDLFIRLLSNGNSVYLIPAMRMVTKHSLEQQTHTIFLKSFWSISCPQADTEKKVFTETVNKGKQFEFKKGKDEYSEKQEE